ncbi:hypothetical protein Suden_1740 [Sulfurimonas denitrificans DSM 1251]|uniref:Uncharacterized protein n=1 Tax=Sulfurimonas denitrificans (strain ATCC 33889 / DSM 1251) TaxID=326298 RepID=Q30PR7_SULDN|nr:hypothetical protein [Sulfurimonas denitrificans]ABB45014.1 hypothetical protein Suden_1740 [Sulfurimonas denitrificans DSM 1251]MDD3442228.1 hypothetical protein [Sulfurimonas denitrificans]
MKINFSRQNTYLLAVSLFLLVFVLIFSFAVLIPEGKEYRIKRAELAKESQELKQLSDFAVEKEVILQKLSSEHLHSIEAFEAEFNQERFVKQHRAYFSSLDVSKVQPLGEEDGFSVYEVNTTSEISSPKGFYDFLDSLNKSDWIIGVNFPINFKREGEMIKSSFTMRVYNNKSDSNTTK